MKNYTPGCKRLHDIQNWNSKYSLGANMNIDSAQDSMREVHKWPT